MNRTIFSLLVLLLFGLFSQPSIAQSRQHASQRSAEENVARMSEAEMRAHLPHAKERLKMSQSALKTGNYSKYLVGDDAIAQGVAKAAAEAEYYYYTTLINEIEKRLSKIDSQKPKPQTEQQQQAETEQQQQGETEQQQQGESEQNVEEELQKKFDKKMGELQPFFNELHTDVDAHADDAKHGSEALKSVMSNMDLNSKPITANMMDKPLSPTSETNSGERDGRIGISDKFKENKLEETKEEESEDDKRRRELIEKVQNHLNSLEKQ